MSKTFWVGLAVLAGTGSALAIETLTPAPQAMKVSVTVAQATPPATSPGPQAPAVAGAPGAAIAEPAGSFEPLALALAGAVLMGYIGLRRPRE